MPDVLGTVAELHRFPVKSMLGERLERTLLDVAGVPGDREWALLDADGNWVSAKADRGRWRLQDGMLDLMAASSPGSHGRARTGSFTRSHGTTGSDDPTGSHDLTAQDAPDGTAPVPFVTLPDGRRVRPGDAEADALLSAHLSRDVRFDRGDGGRRWGRHHDAAPLHLVTTATLRALRSDDGGAPAERPGLDPRRLRANLVVDTGPGRTGFVEDDWVGATLRVGRALVRVTESTGRCVMTTRAQADGPARDVTVLGRIGARNGANAGVYLVVVEPGAVAVGDEVSVADPAPAPGSRTP